MSERQSASAGSTRQGKSKSGNSSSSTPWAQALKAARSEAKPAEVNKGLQSPGEGLDRQTRGEFEQRFSHDFGSVRVHADRSAAESAEALQANAYTAGSDIVFGPGRYQPQTASGRALLAHELAHVAQQPEQTGGGGGFQIGRPGSAAERTAETSARRVTAGLAVPAPGIAAPGVIYRDIKADLNEAIDRWGTDEEAIYASIQNASPAEKTAVLSDPILMQDLYDDLSRGEWARVLRLLGATTESRIGAASEGWGTDEDAIYDALEDTAALDIKRQIESSTILMLLRDELSDDELGQALAIIAEKYFFEGAITFPETYHVLVLFPDAVPDACKHLTNRGVNVATDIIANLDRGNLMPRAVVSDINTQIENDNSRSRVEAAFEARWNVNLTARARPGESAPNWTVDQIRRVHRALRQVPGRHVARGAQQVPGFVVGSGEIVDFELDAVDADQGSWDPNTGTIRVGTAFGDVAGLTRHEVGHAMDEFLGPTTVAFKQNAFNRWRWSNSSATWEASMPNRWRRKDGSQVPLADQTAIKAVLDAYVNAPGQKGGPGGLRSGTPPGHAIRTYWNDDVPMIEAAKGLVGKEDLVYQHLGSVKKIGDRYYSWSTYYGEFYVYNEVVQDDRVSNYSLFGHPEFFAEMYEVYYEEGTGPERGEKLQKVPEWKQFFDNTVHPAVAT